MLQLLLTECPIFIFFIILCITLVTAHLQEQYFTYHSQIDIVLQYLTINVAIAIKDLFLGFVTYFTHSLIISLSQVELELI